MKSSCIAAWAIFASAILVGLNLLALRNVAQQQQQQSNIISNSNIAKFESWQGGERIINDNNSTTEKSCKYQQGGKGWLCQACSRSSTRSSKMNCRTIKPKGLCRPISRLEYDSPPRRSSSDLLPHNYNYKHAETQLQYSEITHFKLKETYLQPDCSLTNIACFDLSRCSSSSNAQSNNNSNSNSNSNHSQRRILTVFTPDKSTAAAALIAYAEQQGIVERKDVAEEACLIIISNDMYKEHPPDLFSTPYWQGGRNHFIWQAQEIFDHHGDRPFGQWHLGVAALAASTFSTANLRKGYDMSLALERKWKPPNSTTNTNNNNNNNNNNNYLPEDPHRPRKYLIAFKGEIRPHLMPYYQHRWLAVEYWDHNLHADNSDIVVDVKCPPKIMNYRDDTDYGDLMINSTFHFCPGGGGVSSYRFSETLSVAGIPVIVPEIIPPLAPEIDWSPCVVVVPEQQIIQVPTMLRQMTPEEIRQRQKSCANLFHNVIETEEIMFTVAMKIWQTRISAALQAKAELEPLQFGKHF